ncbi:hypothetical protein B0J11DRAFT_88134 [Dendryphion nanum]|uniref:Uncharacterized protein n=1 Tax=Dendryphion nanum TaxID=256645 RepID=A0A9P9DE39_9PLEO|nr:hypothetical protein B0J11DRAFT_88134 [Dendryphion nanum]
MVATKGYVEDAWVHVDSGKWFLDDEQYDSTSRARTSETIPMLARTEGDGANASAASRTEGQSGEPRYLTRPTLYGDSESYDVANIISYVTWPQNPRRLIDSEYWERVHKEHEKKRAEQMLANESLGVRFFDSIAVSVDMEEAKSVVPRTNTTNVDLPELPELGPDGCTANETLEFREHLAIILELCRSVMLGFLNWPKLSQPV